MNIATDATINNFAPGTSTASLVTKAVPFVIPLPNTRVLFMLTLILLSALGYIYSKDLSRRLYNDYQELQQTSQRLMVAKGELVLEESALTSPAHVQQLAIKDWKMEIPQGEEVIVIN